MTCEVIRFPGGGVQIVCSRGKKPAMKCFLARIFDEDGNELVTMKAYGPDQLRALEEAAYQAKRIDHARRVWIGSHAMDVVKP